MYFVHQHSSVLISNSLIFIRTERYFHIDAGNLMNFIVSSGIAVLAEAARDSGRGSEQISSNRYHSGERRTPDTDL